MEEDLDFFLDNNAIKKNKKKNKAKQKKMKDEEEKKDRRRKLKPYPTKIKSRNFLSNIEKDEKNFERMK